ncbi:hypothetical protein GQ53DRAFT_768577 [Thozetella sp. PMI_491]|nr:hypothetical protein GQ53DRAFT_768577 [Thozetella sp. PMI_491]
MTHSNYRTAPSDGAKVHLGKDAPVTREGAGYVASDSLAAESFREGGAFASNRGGQPDEAAGGDSRSTDGPQFHEPAQDPAYETRQFAPTQEGSSNTHRIPNAEQGATAPSYVNTQYSRDASGPHGKNITEGFDDSSQYRDGLKAAFNAEPGSEDDPSRIAEQNFQKKVAGTGAGPKDARVGIDGGYDVLKSDEAA